MDTNLIALLLTRNASSNGSTLIVGFTLLLAALNPVLLAIAAYFASKAAKNNKELEKTVKEIHVAVNSERTAMVATVKDLRDEILRISKDNAQLQENARGRDVAEALNTTQKADSKPSS